ncbi:MAG: hypothetical protein ACXW1D_00520 [Halobacteriota archaeon]
MILIREHKSASYAPRTYANAHDADVTIALAVNYFTGGEKCTHKAAGDTYLKLDPLIDDLQNSRKLWSRLHLIGKQKPTVNVAGNGIYTLSKHGWTQDMINCYVLKVLERVHQHWPIGKIVSGGQTGVDLAGGYAGWKLGIDTVLTLPKGFKQRHEDGVDVEHTEEEIRNQIIL